MQRGAAAEIPDFRQQVGSVTIGGVMFPIFRGQTATFTHGKEKVGRMLIEQAYRGLTGDDRILIPYELAKEVVLVKLDLAWHESDGRPESPAMVKHLEEAMAKAKAAEPANEAEAGQEKKAKEPRVTARSIIEGGLRRTEGAYKPEEVDEIVAEVKKHFPNGKADASHVQYYRHFMIRNGELPKREKPPKAEKATKAAAEEGDEETPAKGNNAAARNQRQQAAASAASKTGPKPGREAASDKAKARR